MCRPFSVLNLTGGGSSTEKNKVLRVSVDVYSSPRTHTKTDTLPRRCPYSRSPSLGLDRLWHDSNTLVSHSRGTERVSQGKEEIRWDCRTCFTMVIRVTPPILIPSGLNDPSDPLGPLKVGRLVSGTVDR